MNMKIALRALSTVIFVIIAYGFIIPALVSAASDILVGFGLLLAFLLAPILVFGQVRSIYRLVCIEFSISKFRNTSIRRRYAFNEFPDSD